MVTLVALRRRADGLVAQHKTKQRTTHNTTQACTTACPCSPQPTLLVITVIVTSAMCMCACACTDEDFEHWCVSLFEALEASPDLLGAAAGSGEDSLATYRVTLVEGEVTRGGHDTRGGWVDRVPPEGRRSP